MSNIVVNFLIVLPIIIFSVIVHENAHGIAAFLLGDKTAKNAGRLSLNPIKHIDPFGSVLLPLILAFTGMPIFGYAKPVPINPRYFKDQRRGMMLTAAAGPASNLLTAAFFAQLYKFIVPLSLYSQILSFVVLINVVLAVFNLLPIPPLDGSKVLAGFIPSSMLKSYYRFEYFAERYFILIFLLIMFVWPSLLLKVLLLFINPILKILGVDY